MWLTRVVEYSLFFAYSPLRVVSLYTMMKYFLAFFAAYILIMLLLLW